MKNQQIWMISIGLIISMIDGATSSACECPPTPDLRAAVNESSAIFLGTAAPQSVAVPGKDYVIWGFSVEKGWKGVTGIKTQTKVRNTKCGYHFEPNKKYLVYASELGPIYTSRCGRTKPAEMAEKDIRDLGPSNALK